jgi:hypothetical protein
MGRMSPYGFFVAVIYRSARVEKTGPKKKPKKGDECIQFCELFCNG